MALSDFVLPVLLGITAIVAQNAHKELKWPFIDELFHLRQCAAYCAHSFHVWDHKITTPPGLYILGTWWHHLLKAIGVPNSCGATALRLLNLFGGIVVLPLMLSMIPTDNFWRVNIVSLPLLYTYCFLFYTDVWSTILVILPLVIVTRHRSVKGAVYANIVGFASLWLRQTNIVWLAFAAVVLIDRRKHLATPFWKQVPKFITQCFRDWLLLVPFAVNAFLFAAFVYYNGGITFGDKDNHQMTLHLVQLFYCASFLTFFFVPIWISPSTIRAYVKFTLAGRKRLNILFTLASYLLIYYIVKHYTVVHPFLLADNRHYTFYIYRKILSHPSAVYVTVPFYHFSLWVTIHLLAKLHKSSMLSLHPISIIALVGAAAATLVPSPLFEPRYYIVPLVTLRIFIRPGNELLARSQIHMLEFLWYLTINSVFFVIFFNYRFTWFSEPGIQRIIW